MNGSSLHGGEFGDFVANMLQLERSVDALREENKRLREELN